MTSTMEPEEEAYLNSLIAARHTTKGDTARVVTIPGFGDLTREQQLWIASKVDKLESGTSLDTDALVSALESVQRQREISPSSSEWSEGNTEIYPPGEGLRREEESRTELLEEGCPPCYPPGLGFPIPDPAPEPYREIINYWRGRAGCENGRVLGTQLVYWRQQLGENRVYYSTKSTGSMQRAIRRRRKKHNIQRATDPDPIRPLDSCDRLQKWIFFQDRQLQEWDYLRARLDLLKREPGIPGVDMLSFTLWNLETHKVFMRWVEEQRFVIERELNQTQTTEDNAVAQEPPPADKAKESVELRAKSSRTRKQPKNPPVLSDGRVAKRAQAPRRSARPRQSTGEVPNPLPKQKSNGGAAAAPSSIRAAKSSGDQQKKTGRRQMTRTQATPVSLLPKPKGIAKRKANPPKKSRNNIVTAALETRTRSGRISRPPNAWVP